MKRNLFTLSAVLLIGAAAVYSHKAITSNTEVSDIVLENAEALAENEPSGPSIPTIPCVKANTVCTYFVYDAENKLSLVDTYNAKSAQ